MAQEQEQAADRVAQVVTAAPGSRLESLLASYDSAKAAAEESAARFKAITDGIKAEAGGVNPKATDISVSGAPGLPRLKLTWKRPWKFDTGRFKEENPLLYVTYATQGGHWELRAV